MSRACYLSPQQQFNLNMACRTVEESIGGVGVFLVGSATKRRDFRDVDVRLMLDDDAFALMFPGVDPCHTHRNAYWSLINAALSMYLSQHSGLPVDFQIQQMTWANANHDDVRLSLGNFYEPGAA